MKRFFFCLFVCSLPWWGLAQDAEHAPLPAIFSDLENALVVHHFPAPVLASMDPSSPDIYFWKHNTAVLAPGENVKVEEGGAYIFVNGAWKLRVRMGRREFSRLFKIRKGILKAGQPYTFANNWRRDTRLVGGWAMWYVIGRTSSGKRVYGVGKLETVGRILSTTHP